MTRKIDHGWETANKIDSVFTTKNRRPCTWVTELVFPSTHWLFTTGGETRTQYKTRNNLFIQFLNNNNVTLNNNKYNTILYIHIYIILINKYKEKMAW